MFRKAQSIRSAKKVLILHGFPEPIGKDHPLYNYFTLRKYGVTIPQILSSEVVLNSDLIRKTLKSEFKDSGPEVIVGFSMGGLIAPYIAADYPKAKLILIATGPYLKTESRIYNFLIKICQLDRSLFLVRIGKIIPRGMFRVIYKFYNKNPNSAISEKEYRDRADNSLKAFYAIPYFKLREVLQFVIRTDNSRMLGKLQNETLIVSGKKDKMMPSVLSEELKKLVRKSRLVEMDELHFDVAKKISPELLDEFLFT